MKFHTKRRLMESIKHIDTYLVTFLNHIQSCHVCSWPLSKQILDVLQFGKHLIIICQTLRYFNSFSGHSSHLLKGSNIIVLYQVLMVHICIGSIKACY